MGGDLGLYEGVSGDIYILAESKFPHWIWVSMLLVTAIVYSFKRRYSVGVHYKSMKV